MKKVFVIVLIGSMLFSFSSCFLFGDSTIYPDMVEYPEEEVLEIAKDKYSITQWIFIGSELQGEAWYDAEGVFQIEAYEHTTQQYSLDFVNGDNTEKAMTAFAGKNGGHDIQGQFQNFLCYVALAKCADGSLKFIYYNTNIHKDAEIVDTIGASDYTFEVLPTELTNELFTVSSEWHDMTLYLNQYKDMNPRGFIYSGERLTVMHRERYGGISYMAFYKENGKIVFDLYHDKDEFDRKDERRLVYSTSDRYGVIYNYYGVDQSQYFDITQKVTQSPDEENVMVLWGQVETKEIDGTVLYSDIGYRATYQVLRDGRLIESNSSDSVTDNLNFDQGYGMDKIDGVDHTQTAKFTVYDFYIFYEKNTKIE